MIIREIRKQDLPAVAAIEERQTRDGWTRGMLASELAAAGCVRLLAEETGEVSGYIFCRYVAGEAEVLRLCVAESYRRQGIGDRLMSAALQRLALRGSLTFFLEVRRSNIAARRLYDAHGFVDVGLRRHYYRGPREDGVIMRKR